MWWLVSGHYTSVFHSLSVLLHHSEKWWVKQQQNIWRLHLHSWSNLLHAHAVQIIVWEEERKPATQSELLWDVKVRCGQKHGVRTLATGSIVGRDVSGITFFTQMGMPVMLVLKCQSPIILCGHRWLHQVLRVTGVCWWLEVVNASQSQKCMSLL